MSKQDETEFLSIDVADLSAVTGGTHRPGHNDQLTAALTSITESLKSLKTENNNSSNSLSQLLPLMMFAKGGVGGGGCPGGNCGR
jgi:DNA gyrase/topoisomerase IV subunit B